MTQISAPGFEKNPAPRLFQASLLFGPLVSASNISSSVVNTSAPVELTSSSSPSTTRIGSRLRDAFERWFGDLFDEMFRQEARK